MSIPSDDVAQITAREAAMLVRLGYGVSLLDLVPGSLVERLNAKGEPVWAFRFEASIVQGGLTGLCARLRGMSFGKGSLRRPEAEPGKYAAGWEAIFQPTTKRVHMRAKSVQAPYPSWVCHNCAIAAGGREDLRESTWHMGPCGVCGLEKPVTQPRDYGYPRFDVLSLRATEKGGIT